MITSVLLRLRRLAAAVALLTGVPSIASPLAAVATTDDPAAWVVVTRIVA
ncbi:hypothetical protein AB0I60_02810 [Actinosynnema sp. NPDC050436]